MKKLSATAFLFSANLLLHGMIGSAGKAVYRKSVSSIHHTLNTKDIHFDINNRKSHVDLLALAKGDQNKVNIFVHTMKTGLLALQHNARFKLIFKKYFNNDFDCLMARLATIALLETDLDNSKNGALGEKGFFQILTKECTITTKLPGSQNAAKNPEPIIERIKNERGLSRLKNHDYLGIMMIMEDAADVSYTLSQTTTKDKYYKYLSKNFNMTGAIILYHNKGVMLYEIIEELKNEGDKEISFQDILNRIEKKTGKKAEYGESRFKGLKTNFIVLKASGKWLLTGDNCRLAVGFNYANIGSAIHTILIQK